MTFLKKCNQCNERPIGGRNKFCDDCKRIRRISSILAYYKRYPERVNARNANWRKNNPNKSREYSKKGGKKSREIAKAYVDEIKANTQCKDCNQYFHPCQMQFDHLANKKQAIANMVSRGLSIISIQKEISKCEIVCANCHMLRTHKRLKK